MENVKCSVCGKECIPDGCGTGYATQQLDNGAVSIVCYKCCDISDARYLRDNGKLHGYLADNEFTNWPGTLRIPVASTKKSKNNFNATRIDFWLRWEGKNYYGRKVGDNSQCATIRKIK